MVVGAESESYKTLRYLVRAPAGDDRARSGSTRPPSRWTVDDAVAYLAAAPDVPASEGREVQIGGPEVVSYGEMLDRMAVAMDKRPRPKLKVPLLSPALSSHWIGLVTPVDAGVARPLIEGLSTETVVTDRSGARAVRHRAHGAGRGAAPRPRGGARRALVPWSRHGLWRSLVARSVRVGEVPSSNLGSPMSSGC